MALGIAGAGSGVFIALMFSKYSLNINQLDSVVLYTGISIFSGLMIKSLLPSVEERLKNEIDNMKGAVKNIGSEIDTVKSEQRYIKVIEMIDNSLSDGNSDMILETIRNASEILPQFQKIRSLNIKLARLYRRLSEKVSKDEYLDSAINVLQNFIDTLMKKSVRNKEDDYAIATAKFNIACYMALKCKQKQGTDRAITVQKISSILTEAITIDPSLKKDIDEDNDFEEIRAELKNLTA